jgi:hypothetical protein
VRGVNFIETLKNFVDMFEDIEIIKNSVALLINKASPKKTVEILRK